MTANNMSCYLALFATVRTALKLSGRHVDDPQVNAIIHAKILEQSEKRLAQTKEG